MNRWPIPSSASSAADVCNSQRHWSSDSQADAVQSPCATLLEALKRFEVEGFSNNRVIQGNAVDLGCGNGRDTAELLRRNWRVLAIDGDPQAITRLRQRHDINRTYLEVRVQRFQELILPPEVDLINASYCLPFCPPDRFPDLWDEIVTALRPGGRFCGQLFGERDSWSVCTDISFHSRFQVEALLAPFEIEVLKEKDHPSKTASGEDKYCHLFSIVARKR